MPSNYKVVKHCKNCGAVIDLDNKICPSCGKDPDVKESEAGLIGCAIIIFIVFVLLISLIVRLSTKQQENNTYKYENAKIQTIKEEEKTKEEQLKKEAQDFIITMEATGVIKEISTKCSDSTSGCYKFLIDENLWKNQVSYEIKQLTVTACEIYANNHNAKYWIGQGYYSGKKLFDSWGIK